VARFVAVNWRDLRNPDSGGAEVHLHEILKRLAADGHEVTYFVSNFDGGVEEETYDGIRVLRRGRWYNANYVLPYHVRSYLRDHPSDLVIEDINKIPFFLPLVTRARVIAVVPHLLGRPFTGRRIRSLARTCTSGKGSSRPSTESAGSP
jgi:glycosyltransferase involved in cell wall biosynthesis